MKKLSREKIERSLKKGFKVYSLAVVTIGLIAMLTPTVFAADDPIAVVNNLSDEKLYADITFAKKVVKIGAHEAPYNYFLDSVSWASFANLASLLSLRSLFSSFLIASCFIYSSVAAQLFFNSFCNNSAISSFDASRGQRITRNRPKIRIVIAQGVAEKIIAVVGNRLCRAPMGGEV